MHSFLPKSFNPCILLLHGFVSLTHQHHASISPEYWLWLLSNWSLPYDKGFLDKCVNWEPLLPDRRLCSAAFWCWHRTPELDSVRKKGLLGSQFQWLWSAATQLYCVWLCCEASIMVERMGWAELLTSWWLGIKKERHWWGGGKADPWRQNIPFKDTLT